MCVKQNKVLNNHDLEHFLPVSHLDLLATFWRLWFQLQKNMWKTPRRCFFPGNIVFNLLEILFAVTTF